MSLSPVPNGTTVYLDNFYFYKSTVVSQLNQLESVAPTPTVSASNVISMFSNAYTSRSCYDVENGSSVGSALTEMQIG
jgi:hypothetical protein